MGLSHEFVQMGNGPVKGISHIAIAVPSLDRAAGWVSLFPGQRTSRYRSESQGVEVLVIHTASFDVEIMEPIDDHSKINGFLGKNPTGGIHHVCFYVESLQAALDFASEHRVRKITLGSQTGIVHDSPVAFLNPRDLGGVLVEFEQVKSDYNTSGDHI